MSEFYLDPQIRQYAHLDLIAKQVVEGFITGLHKSPFHGFSVEFAEHRLYNKGESTRHIDWKLYARTEKLFIKNYEEETNMRCQLVIDDSPSMYFPQEKNVFSKMQFSVFAAAAVVELMRKQRDASGLSLFSENVDVHYPARSTESHRKLLLHELDTLLNEENKNHRESFVARSLHDIAERVHKRSMIVIFSDMLDHRENLEDIFSALRHLKHNKHEVILFHVYDKSLELDFEFENRPYRFVDVETGDEMKVQPQEVKEEYRRRMETYFREIELECGRFGIDFVAADIRKGFHQVLYPYLVKRQSMV